MAQLTMHLFGTPRCEVDGAVVNPDRRKGVALLAYLAVTGRAHSRDAIATLLWPDYDQVTARSNLRRTLSILHAALHDQWLVIDRENLALPAAPGLWVDVSEFQRSLVICPTGGHSDSEICPQCIGRLEEAAGLYTDDQRCPMHPTSTSGSSGRARACAMSCPTCWRSWRAARRGKATTPRPSATRGVASAWTPCTSRHSAS